MSSFWQDRPVFVTGATGLLGSWLSTRLVSLGADVVCLIRDWAPQSELVRPRLIERLKVVRGDVRDQALAERILGEYEIDTVFHLAAQTLVPVANANPISTFETNIRGTWTLLEACRRSRSVKQIVQASSDKAYGQHADLPYCETTPLDARYPYDVSKACADLMAQGYASTYNLPVVITRCGNFYGGGDLNWNRLIPGTIRSALRGRRPVIRSDGRLTRDYFYVEDAVACYLLLAESLAAGREVRGEAFNFSNELQMTSLEVVRTILDLLGSKLEPEIRNEASNEIPHQHLSAEKARRVLGWKPLHTLEAGLTATIEWYRRFFAHADES